MGKYQKSKSKKKPMTNEPSNTSTTADNPKMFFINTRITDKIQKRIEIFNKFRNGKFELLILNSKEEELGCRILECASIFQEQLPFMPKSYIITQSLDLNNYILAIVNEGRIVTCLLFRPFIEHRLAEIVFLASSSSSQASGFGYLNLAIFKEVIKRFQLEIKTGKMTKEFIEQLHVKITDGIEESFVYTYADFQACSFFRKHQFTKSITNQTYKGLIKDYEGGYLMECILSREFNYLTLPSDLLNKKLIANEQLINENAVKPDEKNFLLDHQTTRDILSKMEITIRKPNSGEQFINVMKFIITTLKSEPASWPFLEPVNPEEVPEYPVVIKHPMDLFTMSCKIRDGVYKNLSEFKEDFELIIKNCYTFNGTGNIYSKKATELEKKFKAMFKRIMINLKSPTL